MTIALKEEAARRKQCASALAAETLCLLVALEVLPLAVIAQYIAAAGGGFGHFGPWRSQNMLRKVTQSGACDRSAERVLFAHLHRQGGRGAAWGQGRQCHDQKGFEKPFRKCG